MHELSICQALLDQVNLVAGQSSSERVEKIVIAIGPLAGVAPCGGYRTRVVAGQELRLLRVEMRAADSPQTLN